MKKIHRFYTFLSALVVGISIMGLAGCAQSTALENKTQEEVSENTAYVPKIADSLDEAVISKINEKKQEITFYNTSIGRFYTLEYDGTTSIKNKYDEELTIRQLRAGDLVITSFIKEDKKVKTIQLKKDAFVAEDVSDFKIQKLARTMMIGDKQYQLSKYLSVIANGQAGELEDINQADVLRVSGTDYMINSIVVAKGHGYLSLANDEYFIGGWIEVGENIIKPITEKMLLTVPEGEYDILITNKGHGGIKRIVVEANKETIVDIGDLKGEEVKTGKLIFTITPAEATLAIDGKEVDYSSAVTLEYGIHQIVLKAEGYKTMTKSIKVGSELANINIEMEEGDSGDSVSSNSTNSNSSTNSTTNNSTSNTNSNSGSNGNTGSSNNTTSGNSAGDTNTGTSLIGDTQVESSSTKPLVYIEAPVDAQLYLDGEYVGVVPTSFVKVEGDHEVSFKKEGYETRSYTLYFDDGDNNMTFSFAELVAIE